MGETGYNRKTEKSLENINIIFNIGMDVHYRNLLFLDDHRQS